MEPQNQNLILVANDDLFFGGRILSVLAKSGRSAVTASAADEAVDKAITLRPTLAIVNLNSRRLGGIELIRRLRHTFEDLRILAFLSHSLIPPVRDEIFAAGADKLATNGAVSSRLPQIVEDLLAGVDTGDMDECEP